MPALAWLEPLALLVGLGALSLAAAGTLHAARWARARLEPPRDGWRPFASVIVPSRGYHQGLEANLRAIASQDYPEYEVLVVVDSLEDPCAPAAERLAAADARVRVLVSEPEVVGRDWATGKIVAQLTGLRHASPRSEVFVFADADARPEPRWLASLAGALAEPGVGGATGYRWYHAEGQPTVWTALRDAWNAVGLDAFTMERFRFLWGGSMAVKRADFERSAVDKEWRWTVSEDVGLTRAVRALGLRLAFVPAALVASPEDWPRREVLEWVVRQTALTRAAMPRLYRFAAALYALSLVLLAMGLGLVALWPSPLLGLAGLGMLAPVLSAGPRAWLRQRMALRALPALRARPRRERALQLLLSAAVPFFMLWVLARARRVSEVAWRGRRYALPAPKA